MYEKPVLISIDMRRAFDLPNRPRRWNGDLDANGLALLRLEKPQFADLRDLPAPLAGVDLQR